ncbi:MAG: ATP synthase delta/epsilon chain alpha-helix domain-containing protein, partial [Gaiellaceae bacterium]
MEEALSRARERLEQASGNAIDPSQTRAAFERAKAQMEALTQMGAELEAILPEEIGLAVREGLRAETLPVARQLAELRGLTNQLIRRLGELEQEIEAERLARVEDLGLLVDLIAGGWRGADERLARIEESLNGGRATVYSI